MADTALRALDLRSRFSSALCNVCLTGHAAVFGLWWWFMPSGFPVNHAKFWSNSVVPLLGFCVCLLGRWLGHRKQIAARSVLMVALGAGWIAVALSALQTFPITARVLWVIPMLAGLAIIGAAFLSAWKTEARMERWTLGLAIFFGAALGFFLTIAQRSAEPATKPSGGEWPPAAPGEMLDTAKGWLQLSEVAGLGTSDGVIIYTHGASRLSLSTLLTFESRSPDACWTLFAGTRDRVGPERKLAGAAQRGSRVTLEYKDDAQTALQVDGAQLQRALEIDARSRLVRPVWSHLNAFTTLNVHSTGPLSVSFSPCPEYRIAMRAMKEGTDRVAEFAYLDSGDVFRIAASTQAEKGPFRQLASGRLVADTPLAVTFFEGNVPIFRVTLKDWAAQTSRQLSPTAGWGVPENAIEFLSDNETHAHVFFTLAATSVGRGFESVGHTPGIYVNRLVVEGLP